MTSQVFITTRTTSPRREERQIGHSAGEAGEMVRLGQLDSSVYYSVLLYSVPPFPVCHGTGSRSHGWHGHSSNHLPTRVAGLDCQGLHPNIHDSVSRMENHPQVRSDTLLLPREESKAWGGGGYMRINRVYTPLFSSIQGKINKKKY